MKTSQLRSKSAGIQETSVLNSGSNKDIKSPTSKSQDGKVDMISTASTKKISEEKLQEPF